MALHKNLHFFAHVLALLLLLVGCSQPKATQPEVVRLDYAYYNPLSLVLKEKGWLKTPSAGHVITDQQPITGPHPAVDIVFQEPA